MFKSILCKVLGHKWRRHLIGNPRCERCGTIKWTKI